MQNSLVVARNTFDSTAIYPLEEKTTDPKSPATMEEAVRRG